MWLRYSKSGSAEARKFTPLRNIAEQEVELETVRSLRHIVHSHTLSDRALFSVQLGADEMLVTAAWEFAQAFWTADERWYSASSGGSAPAVADEASTGLAGDELTEFIAVTIEGGKQPVEYLEGNKYLRSASFELIGKYPRER